MVCAERRKRTDTAVVGERERGVGGEGSRKALFPVIVSSQRLKGVLVCSFSLTLVTAGRLCLYTYIYMQYVCLCLVRGGRSDETYPRDSVMD